MDYNHEIKVLADLKYRHAHIECHGSYGNNPSISILTRTSVIRNGFIKDVDVNFTGYNEKGERQFERYLIIDSEYGHEIELPYEKVIGITILSSKEQADLEMHIHNAEKWKNQLDDYNNMINSGTIKDEHVEFIKEMIGVTERALKRGEELIAKGVKTFK